MTRTIRRSLGAAFVAYLVAKLVYLIAVGHPHRCVRCGRPAWCAQEDCGPTEVVACPECEPVIYGVTPNEAARQWLGHELTQASERTGIPVDRLRQAYDKGSEPG